jgi:HSP20 family protein
MNTEMTNNIESTNAVARESTHGGRFYRPNVDILETNGDLLVKADMPGTKVENITLNYDKGTLTLHATVEHRQPQNMQYLMREFDVADFHREFVVNEEIDTDKISADYKNGVLTICLPKAESAKPKRINVVSK